MNRTVTGTTRRPLSACFIGSAVRRPASLTALAATAAAVSHRCRPAAAEGRGGVKPRLTSWGSVGAESGSLVGHRTSGSHLERGGEAAWSGTGRRPGCSQGGSQGSHVCKSAWFFFGEVVLFFFIQVQPHLLCSDDLRTTLCCVFFFFLRVFGKVRCLSKNSPYQCFHNVRPHPVSELGELLSTEKGPCFSSRCGHPTLCDVINKQDVKHPPGWCRFHLVRPSHDTSKHVEVLSNVYF